MKKVIHIPTPLRQLLVPIEDLVIYDNNPRKHKKDGINSLANTIKEHGFLEPLIIDQNNRIAAGHGRRLAAIELGMKEVPCLKVHCETEEEFVRIVIEHNKVGELSKWDNKKLASTMEWLDSLTENDLQVSGFTNEELDKLFGTTFKETLETKADFGESGEIDVMDDATRVTSMTFKLAARDHKKIKSVLGAIMRENDFETTGEALLFMTSKFKGPERTIRRQA